MPANTSLKERNAWIAQSTTVQTRTPTEETYLDLQQVFSVFNKELFDERLPDCVITLQRRFATLGYFCRQRFINGSGQQSDEIALNPTYFAMRTEVGVLSTLAHEMAHLWRFHFGTRNGGRAGYHCREWAKRMVAIGLQPSDTGRPGGRQTGYQVSHFVIEHGPFDTLATQMIADGFKLNWLENNGISELAPPVTAVPSASEPDGSHRWKYTCPRCGFNAWAKPASLIECGRCHLRMPKSPGRSRRLIHG